ncbi:hypothetical protein JHK87_000352 [Glycine soja]|nr:hypothetical protein JHK87_000352 [Glycine soja]
MMKSSSHLSAIFLLFFLLTALSPSDGVSFSSFLKQLKQKLEKSPTLKDFLKPTTIGDIYYTLNFTEIFSSEERSAPPVSLIKDYLSNYGYIESSGPLSNSMDQETIISAIKTYQQYFSLQPTGKLNNETLQQMSFLRCGVPDINIDYNFTDDNMSYPKAGHRWFPNTNLTYGFLPENQIPANMTKVFRDSFARWAQASGVLNLTETTYDNADIQVGFYNFTYLGIDIEVYGGSLIFLQPDSTKKGVILLDGTNKLWALPSENGRLSWVEGVLDLESAAMHEIGHLLGLDHSNKEDSVMYPCILPSHQRKVQLSKSDKTNVQHQFANVEDSAGHVGRLGVSLITTLSLGFAYLLLLLY